VNMQEQAFNDERVRERQKTMFTDADAALKLLEQGQIDSVIQLGVQRLQMLEKMGVDASDTRELTQLAIGLKNGDQKSGEFLKKRLAGTVQAGISAGILQPPAGPQMIPNANINNGQVAFMGANGPVAMDVQGYRQAPANAKIPEAMQTLQMRAEESGLQKGTPEYQEFMRSGGNPTRAGQASAVTRTYDNGTVLQVLPDGSTEVLGPDGQPVTGEARVQALRTAREEQVDFAQARSAATTRGKGDENRLQLTIDEGLDAAQGVPILKRAIQLLDEVPTGGFNNVAMKAKQMFGVEGADEGELSGLLGKAVLQQLKSTFGAAFTEREGDRLSTIEAGFGKSPAANRRLLNQTLTMVERAANRAIDAAYESGDDRTARDIEQMLDFVLTDAGGQQGGDVIAEADAILGL
jgi:hypothetical protein